ncbi:hypothetical protein O181_074619 [Austropuccinia psidii MF-1]|uniref:Uncharacterized protein n=1 Tax=Austropuccinia psidii MF-1 TaxID=1389203 RepID=A0A9Q3F9E5_9BASI|nr:hypothetical protein [Austropuccinia psidii MF-1]
MLKEWVWVYITLCRQPPQDSSKIQRSFIFGSVNDHPEPASNVWGWFDPTIVKFLMTPSPRLWAWLQKGFVEKLLKPNNNGRGSVSNNPPKPAVKHQPLKCYDISGGPWLHQSRKTLRHNEWFLSTIGEPGGFPMEIRKEFLIACHMGDLNTSQSEQVVHIQGLPAKGGTIGCF